MLIRLIKQNQTPKIYPRNNFRNTMRINDKNLDFLGESFQNQEPDEKNNNSDKDSFGTDEGMILYS